MDWESLSDSQKELALRKKAFWRLVLATLFWGLSFPLLKAAGELQQQMVTEPSSWPGTAAGLAIRFAGAAILLFIWAPKSLRNLTRSEISQGLGLGFFGGAGLLFQVDGMAYTSASISAFLTQAYCLILPIIVAVRDRRLPRLAVWVSAILMIIGVGILAGISLTNFQIRRGEAETLIASLIFAGQILWLERPDFKENDVTNFSLVMFATVALVCAVISAFVIRHPSDVITMFANTKILGLTVVLTVICTLGAYILMNRWQSILPAAEAGLIYGFEPLFASFFALFLPGLISSWAVLNYPNERITRNLVMGGGLILVANVLIQSTQREMKTPGKPRQQGGGDRF